MFTSNREKNCAGSPFFVFWWHRREFFKIFILKEYANHFKIDICTYACSLLYMYYFTITIIPIAKKELDSSKSLNK